MRRLAVTSAPSRGLIYVRSPYNEEFIQRARALGGSWNNDHHTLGAVWEFPDAVRDEIVTVHVDVTWAEGASVDFAGQTLARRHFSNRTVHVMDGVTLVSGGFSRRGGSQRFPELSAEDSTVLAVQVCRGDINLGEPEGLPYVIQED